MSSPPQQTSTHRAASAHVHLGTWDDTTRAHPAMKWMEHYTRHVVDARYWDEPAEKYHTPDFSVQKPSGALVEGADAAWKTIAELYAPFARFRHEPTFLVYWDEEGGESWGMMGSADVWFALPGLSGDAVKDREGGAWDGCNVGAFIFRYVRDKGGEIKLQSTKIFTDLGPTFKLMLQKGLIDAETLKGIVIGS